MRKNIKLKNMKNTILPFIGVLFLSMVVSCTTQVKEQKANQATNEKPRIVNIVNFIRLLEPREEEITEDVLYQTVVTQLNLMNKYNLGGTFLLQYDALLDLRYQELLKSLPDSSFEIGAWWEIPQPLCENAGLKWRGRYPWDWHANVGFSVGYTPEEREKLVDTYMSDFKRIFGYYPKSVGSWYIDAHTLNYMYQKYRIVASCNCRDQIGTDGYTLWGGYWNQAYYPSKKNAYMPAQNEAGQIPVPVFRMLGSDPMPQYDPEIKLKRQGNVTIEPVYHYSGRDSAWIYWYLNEFAEGECMEFNYVQIGQENSFTWDKMGPGLEIQFPLIARLRDEKKVRVETLAESGQWFGKKFKTTPATSVTVNHDLPGSDRKTVWFDSRFFRANLFWEHGTFRITDIHLFDEDFQSDYLKGVTETSQFFLYTLPFIDGYTATRDTIAGLQLKAEMNGIEVPVIGKDPFVDDSEPGKLQITWPVESLDGKFVFTIDEQKLGIKLESSKPVKWFFELGSANNASSHFTTIKPPKIDCRFKGIDYSVTVDKGTFIQSGNGILFRIIPDGESIVMDFSRNSNQN